MNYKKRHLRNVLIRIKKTISNYHSQMVATRLYLPTLLTKQQTNTSPTKGLKMPKCYKTC